MNKTNVKSIQIGTGQGSSDRIDQAYVCTILDLSKINSGEYGIRYYTNSNNLGTKFRRWLVRKQLDTDTWLIELITSKFKLICINDTPIMMIIDNAFEKTKFNVALKGVEDAKQKILNTFENKESDDFVINNTMLMDCEAGDELWVIHYVYDHYKKNNVGNRVKNKWIKELSFYSDLTYNKNIDIYSLTFDNGEVNILINFSGLELKHDINFYADKSCRCDYYFGAISRDDITKALQKWAKTPVLDKDGTYIIIGIYSIYTGNVDSVIIDLNKDTIVSIYCKLYAYFEDTEYTRHTKNEEGKLLNQSFGNCIRVEDRNLGDFNILKVSFSLKERLKDIRLITPDEEDNIKNKLTILNMGKTQGDSEYIREIKSDTLHVNYNCKSSCNILYRRDANTIKENNQAYDI